MTVAELIAKLQEMPPSATVTILTPQTYCDLYAPIDARLAEGSNPPIAVLLPPE